MIIDILKEQLRLVFVFVAGKILFLLESLYLVNCSDYLLCEVLFLDNYLLIDLFPTLPK